MKSSTQLYRHACQVNRVVTKQRSNAWFRKSEAISQKCCYSDKRGFIGKILENIRQDESSKEMKENLEKFREEAKKLEESEALQKARAKYKAIQSEAPSSTETLKKGLSSIGSKISETAEGFEQTEFVKKTKEAAGKIGEGVSDASESIRKGGEQISKTKTFQTFSEGAKAVKEEIDATAFRRAQVYSPPTVLRKRTEFMTTREVEANESAQDIVMHKDSVWSQSWTNFKENNQYVNKMFDLKMKFDESDNVVIRATRAVTDKMSDLFGGMFTKTEISQVLTEITKMDPDFDLEKFILECRLEIIPNVLEAVVRGELEILEDWCHEAAYNAVAVPIKEARKVLAGQMMEHGPVLVLSFRAQQIMCTKNMKGEVVQGDPNQVLNVTHIWALCRDQTVLDPKAAWRIAELTHTQGNAQFL